MTRVLSALVLLPAVVAVIWFLPPIGTLALAEAVLIVAFVEYARLAARLGAQLPTAVAGVATAAVCAAVATGALVGQVVLLAAALTTAVVVFASGRRHELLFDAAAAGFALLYLGLPLGALAALRHAGPEIPLLLLGTIAASDTAQFYGGRTFGRRLLAPSVSPQKTVEGALCGFAAGTLALVVGGRWALPAAGVWERAALGAMLVGLGIVGDLFESQLKRGAGVKDASSIIPGHGGVLDRIDALLFAGPGFYVFLELTQS